MTEPIVDQADLIADIESFPAKAKAAIMHAQGTGELVDTLGAINSTQTRLGEIKRTAASEVEPDDAGERWSYQRPMKGARSYNTMGIFLATMRQQGFEALPETIKFLRERGVITITWNWTPLQKLMKEGVALRIAPHEIEDGDPDFEIGQYWVPGSASYQRVEEE